MKKKTDKHRWWKIAALALVVCVSLAALYLYSRANQSYDLSDTLGYNYVELPLEQNAFPLWLKAIEEIDSPELPYKLRQTINDVALFQTNASLEEVSGELTEWLASKRAAYDLIGQALEMRLQYLYDSTYYLDRYRGRGIRLVQFFAWLDLAKLKLLAGRFDIEQNKFEAAAKEYLDVVRQGEHMIAGEGGNDGMYQMGARIQNLGMIVLTNLCSNTQTPVPVMRNILKQLSAAPKEDRELAQAYAVTHTLSISNIIINLNEQPLDCLERLQRFAFKCAIDLHATTMFTREIYAHYQTNALNCTTWITCDRSLLKKYNLAPTEKEMELFMDDGWLSNIRLMIKSFINPNFLAAGFLADSASSADSLLQLSFEIRTRRNMIRTFIALQIFRRETGHYPVSLNEIVERGILDEIPIDLFDGQPVRYSEERQLLWSVSGNGVDDGGDKTKDLVFALPE